MKKLIYALMASGMLSGIVIGQEQAPVLSEVEQLKIQVVNLEYALNDEQSKLAQCVAKSGPLQDQANKQYLSDKVKQLKEAIEQAHPGFEFNPLTGQFVKKEP